jgi:hypothetical protein
MSENKDLLYKAWSNHTQNSEQPLQKIRQSTHINVKNNFY